MWKKLSKFIDSAWGIFTILVALSPAIFTAIYIVYEIGKLLFK